MKPLKELVRVNVWDMEPYHCARDEFKGRDASIFLDANENPFNHPFNRYPDPLQTTLKEALAPIKQVRTSQIFLGNGSDEAIDLAFRIFCRPEVDNVVAIAPTYGMYEVCAELNDVDYRPVTLDEGFRLNADKLLAATDSHTKLVFLCTPNNPTANSLEHEEIAKVLRGFQGIVVVDEAYSDFTDKPLFRNVLDEYPNLIVLNTFSKAWGCAAIRLGMAFASEEIIALYNKVKYPYNVNELTQQEAMRQIALRQNLQTWIGTIKTERNNMIHAFAGLPVTEQVYPSDANFFLAKVHNATKVYHYLVDKGIIVRNRSSVVLCGDCLRITVGTIDENAKLLATLIKYKE